MDPEGMRKACTTKVMMNSATASASRANWTCAKRFQGTWRGLADALAPAAGADWSSLESWGGAMEGDAAGCDEPWGAKTPEPVSGSSGSSMAAATLQALDRLLCRRLAGGFLGIATGDGGEFSFVARSEDEYLHGKGPVMGRAFFADHLVARFGAAAGLQQLLQPGFMVIDENLAVGTGEAF